MNTVGEYLEWLCANWAPKSCAVVIWGGWTMIGYGRGYIPDSQAVFQGLGPDTLLLTKQCAWLFSPNTPRSGQGWRG